MPAAFATGVPKAARPLTTPILPVELMLGRVARTAGDWGTANDLGQEPDGFDPTG